MLSQAHRSEFHLGLAGGVSLMGSIDGESCISHGVMDPTVAHEPGRALSFSNFIHIDMFDLSV